MLESAIDVLLVEDNLFDTHTITSALTANRPPFNVCTAASLNEAQLRLAEGQFDIILTDLSLPDSAPVETVASLRRRAPHVPIIVLTSMSHEDLACSTIEQGAQDYITKIDMQPRCLQRSIQYAILRHDSRLEIERLLADVEEKRQSLEKNNLRLAELNETAQRFVDNVSHEFRTPLSVIKEYVSLIQDGLAGSLAEQHRMLCVIGDRSDDLNRMVDDMLDVSRLGAGILHVWRRIHTPAEIVSYIAPSLKVKAELRRLDIEFDVPNGLPEVFCDAEKIGRALTNLAVNAIKFCGDPGRVRIKVRNRPEEKAVRFYVTDNGGGIDATELNSLFNRFTQLDSNLHGNAKGFGLGLSIAKELVELNLGMVNVSSRPNIGSTFSFTVPVANACEIVRRYVGRYMGAEEATNITMLVASVKGCQGASQRNEIDALLNYLLRGSDLSVPIDSNSWAILAKASRTEAELLIERYDNSWQETNRNRPGVALPELDLSITSTWQIPQGTGDLMRAVEQLMNQSLLA